MDKETTQADYDYYIDENLNTMSFYCKANNEKDSIYELYISDLNTWYELSIKTNSDELIWREPGTYMVYPLKRELVLFPNYPDGMHDEFRGRSPFKIEPWVENSLNFQLIDSKGTVWEPAWPE